MPCVPCCHARIRDSRRVTYDGPDQSINQLERAAGWDRMPSANLATYSVRLIPPEGPRCALCVVPPFLVCRRAPFHHPRCQLPTADCGSGTWHRRQRHERTRQPAAHPPIHGPGDPERPPTQQGTAGSRDREPRVIVLPTCQPPRENVVLPYFWAQNRR